MLKKGKERGKEDLPIWDGIELFLNDFQESRLLARCLSISVL